MADGEWKGAAEPEPLAKGQSSESLATQMKIID
jgi:hypothetical protein